MVGFSALSNTLLLTSKTVHVGVMLSFKKIIVLISILSNTFMRIDAVCRIFLSKSNADLTNIIECQSRGSIVAVVGVPLS
jgi:hypothetical protein